MTEIRSVDITLEGRSGPWDHVRVLSLAGREAISQLFSFDLQVVCDPGHDLPTDTEPGDAITIVFAMDGEELRRVHGVLGPIQDNLDATRDHPSYALRVLPRAFRLTLVETQDVFLDRTVPDIIRTKLKRHGLGEGDFEMRLLGSYPERELVVQYQESDLAFVSRLAEHLGISYFFEHEDDHDKIVFTDHPAGFLPTPGAEEVEFRALGDKHDVFALSVTTDILPKSYIVQDYNYRTPLVDLSGSFDLDSGLGGVVEYGAHTKTPEQSDQLARVRAEERSCRRRVFAGKSGRVALTAGAKSTLTDHPKLEGPTALLVTEIEHEAHIPVFGAEGSGGEASYGNRFHAIPADTPFRPRRVTPKPRIVGLITGIIQPGPDGETGGVARLDSEGRYTVQLHFDVVQRGEQKASHPVRMAQPFAGANYGMHMPLRPGTEVLLAFTNGDPDRPLIVGAVYNTASPSPVNASNAERHQIKASTGAIFEFGSRS
jgi:type VI secretion system secreted protein VgrG